MFKKTIFFLKGGAKMPIKINSFGGPMVWVLRKHCSYITSKLALEFASRKYSKKVKAYIDAFGKNAAVPIFKMVNIETVNRCNGTCAFCPANIKAEKRERKAMPQDLFEKIIMELKALDWQGQLFLNINNEPLIDKEIEERAVFIKNQLGDKVTVSMFTNGSLLTVDRLVSLSGGVDELIINNYSETYKLNQNNRKIYQYVRDNLSDFINMDIIINRRYVQEILSTRAGSAPNKKLRNNNVTGPCIYPYTDITIFPDGKVGLCCNDCFEVTEYGDLSKQSLVDIWTGNKLTEVRRRMREGRLNFPFCVECDVVDSGFREKLIENVGD